MTVGHAARSAAPRLWSRLAYAYAALWSAAAGVFLFGVPFEVGETSGNLLQFLAAPPASELFIDTFSIGAWPQPGFLRTFSFATSKLIFDMSDGQYFVAYRALHAALILLLMIFVLRLIRVRSFLTLAVAMLSATAVLGIHTFHEAVRETELNIKLLVPALCLGALNLSASRPRVWKDVLAIALTTYAIFSNELGLLVWVSFAAAYLVGFQGISRRGVVASTAVVIVYFFCRFVLWDVGVPSLIERSSGLGFRVLDPDELVRQFGANPTPLYAYNILMSVLTVLLAEPRSGVFVFVRDVSRGTISLPLLLEVTSSVLTTGVMLWFAGQRWRAWRRRNFADDDRVFVVAAAVVAANAVISYPYLKEVTMSTAGVFYALAMAAPLQTLIVHLSKRKVAFWRGALVCALVVLISVSWTLRGVSFYVDMSRHGLRFQRDWAAVRPSAAGGEQQQALLVRVREQMLDVSVLSLDKAPRWLERLDPQH
jgi:hypothetical protein